MGGDTFLYFFSGGLKFFLKKIWLLDFSVLSLHRNLKDTIMFEDSLFTPLDTEIPSSIGTPQIFTEFLSQIEGWKSKCKNLEWAAPKLGIHIKLHKFYEDLNEFENSIAEGYMGMLGRMQPNAIKCSHSDALNAYDLLAEIKAGLGAFCKKLPEDDCMYKGILGECAAFGHKLNRYDYLFHLCEVRPF